MSTTFIRAAHLKPEIRLAQAISNFEAALSTEQRVALHSDKARLRKQPPDAMDVMRSLSEFERTSGVVAGRRCYGPRFHSIITTVQQFAALGDVVVGGSQNLAACGVWSLVRMTILSIATHFSYIDAISDIFMAIGRTSPRYDSLALLYPRSNTLQTYLQEYFIIVINFCHHIWLFVSKSKLGKFVSALSDPNLKVFRDDLQKWAQAVHQEAQLLLQRKVDENNQKLGRIESWNSKSRHHYETRLRLDFLNLCSSYDPNPSWKRLRKLGKSSLVMHPQYLEWKNRRLRASTLIITGKLGAGKSVLAANIVDDLVNVSRQATVPVAFHFCRYNSAESLDTRIVLGSIIRQLLCGIPIKDIEALMSASRKVSWDVEDLLKTLDIAFPFDQGAYVILDGIDECTSESRKELLSVLEKMVAGGRKICLCLLTRFDTENVLHHDCQLLRDAERLIIPEQNADIENYIDAEVLSRHLNGDLSVGNQTLITSIQEKLKQKSQGMFLWVALQLDTLCTLATDEKIQQAIDDLPEDLYDTYSRVLKGKVLKQGQLALQKRTLELIAVAFRPLTLEELREALAVMPGDADWQPSKMINNVKAVLALCGALIVVDEDDLTVTFVHHSCLQYIFSEACIVFESGNLTEMGSHETMAHVLLTYLNYGVFDTQISNPKAIVPQLDVNKTPSLVVASMNSALGEKAARLFLKKRQEPTIDIGPTIFKTMTDVKLEQQAQFALLSYAKSSWLDHMRSALAHPKNINIEAWLIVGVIGRFAATCIGDEEYFRKLCLCAEHGNIPAIPAVVQSLLEHRILLQLYSFDECVEFRTRIGPMLYSWPPQSIQILLQWAIDNDFSLLLDALIGEQPVHDNFGLLMEALRKPKTRVARMLARKPGTISTPNQILDVIEKVLSVAGLQNIGKDDFGKLTALQKHDIIRSLGLNLEVLNDEGQTALMLAAKAERLPVVKVLLLISARVSSRDSAGNTALMHAANEGHFNVFYALLSAEGRTDLHLKN